MLREAMQCIKYIMEWLGFKDIFFYELEFLKSLAQVWICSRKENAMLKSQDWQSQSMARLKWLKAQVIELCFIFNLSIGMSYYQDGCNIVYLTRSEVLIDHPSEDPDRKPLRTNLKILEWSGLDLVDQVESYRSGSGFSNPDRSGGPVWPVRGSNG